MAGNRIAHQDIVKKLLDSKTVDFGAIGKMVTELGPSMAAVEEPWETICGTGNSFIRLFILNPHTGPVIDNPVISKTLNK